MSFKYVLISTITAFFSNAFACSVNSPSLLTLAVSTVEEKIFSYDLKTIDEIMPTAVVSNCRETASKRRFVMITFGPNVIEMSDGMKGNNFDRLFNDESTCSIKNNPLTLEQTLESKENEFSKKWKYINECVEVTVSEVGNRQLSFPLDQTGCNITKISGNTATFNGGYCFFRPGPDSEYHVSLGVKDSCKSRDGFKEMGVSFLDLESEMGFFTASDYKEDVDLSAFGTVPVRLSTNPLKSLFKTSDDFGILRPTFPGDFPVNDIHLGKIKFSKLSNKFIQIKTPLIVNNVCKDKNKDGFISSICNYASPYIAEVKLINSKGKVEASWFDGGIAPAQWQGILNGEGFQFANDLIKTNEDYRLEFTFSDPYFEFNAFKKRILSKFSAIESFKVGGAAGSGIGDVPEIKDVSTVEDMMTINPVPDLDFNASMDGIDQSRRRLSTYFSSTLYPPMYEKACRPDTGVCQNLGEPFVKIIASFKIDESYMVLDLEVERKSKLLGSYKRKIIEQPEFICE